MPTMTKAALREKLLAARRGVTDDGSRHRGATARPAARAGGVERQHGVRLRPGRHRAGVDRHARHVAAAIGARCCCRPRAPPPTTPRCRCAGASTGPGELTRGRWGLLEPPEPLLPASALAEAVLVLVPTLAVDRCGVRLGRGSGFYDRSLGGRDPAARLVAVVRDDEVLDELPAEPHDVRMTDALTPHGGLIPLFGGGHAGECDESRGGSST